MTVNAGALRLRAAGLGAGRRAEARAVALGVRQHLLRPQSPGAVVEPPARAGSRGRRWPRPPAGRRPARRRRRPGAAGSPPRAGRAAAARPRRDPPSSGSGRDQRGGVEHRHRRRATTAPPGPRRAGPDDPGARPSAPGAGLVHRRQGRRAGRAPGHERGRRGRTTTRQPTAVCRGSVQSRTAMPVGRRRPRRAPAAGRPRQVSAAGHALGRRRHAGPGSSRRPARPAAPGRAAVLVERPASARGRRARRPSRSAGSRQRRPAGRRPRARRRSAPPAAVRPLEQPGRGAEERISHVLRPPVSASRATARQIRAGTSTLGQLGGRQPHREDVVGPAGGPPDPGGRRRPDHLAGGGDVQFGEHLGEVDGGDRVHRAAVRARPGRRAPARARSTGAEPVRHQDGRAGSSPGAGSRVHRRRSGAGRPVRCHRGWMRRSSAVTGHRQARDPVDPGRPHRICRPLDPPRATTTARRPPPGLPGTATGRRGRCCGRFFSRRARRAAA